MQRTGAEDICESWHFYLTPLFGGWWLISEAANSDITVPLPFYGCLLFLQTSFTLSSILDE